MICYYSVFRLYAGGSADKIFYLVRIKFLACGVRKLFYFVPRIRSAGLIRSP